MTPELIKQISVQLENKPDRLSRIVSALAREKLNILAMTIGEHRQRGVIRLVMDNMRKAEQVLRGLNVPYTQDDVLQVPMRNRPGALAEVCEKLAGEHLSIDYAYSNAAGTEGKSVGIFKVANAARALKLLAEANQPKRNGFAKMGRKGRNARSAPEAD
jgi:hypothetical protein